MPKQTSWMAAGRVDHAPAGGRTWSEDADRNYLVTLVTTYRGGPVGHVHWPQRRAGSGHGRHVIEPLFFSWADEAHRVRRITVGYATPDLCSTPHQLEPVESSDGAFSARRATCSSKEADMIRSPITTLVSLKRSRRMAGRFLLRSHRLPGSIAECLACAQSARIKAVH